MRMPGFRLVVTPSRKTRDTVPGVVGAQDRVVGAPTAK